ncbi:MULTISPECIES: NAD(P)-dependent oxidoreductase [Moorena]|uniref:Hydroxyacid dehydrogenase/reductase family protein n=1 Tax=Moorena producens 3L TaxID=489825 RepID=F4XS15_9CYAN|nr:MULTISPECIES: NAD(P)-dependent oxidoreductase [Moorena]NEQ16209.1 NAD(P)-dependent oxidoreductase [Moorena sp. SIO3E2]NES80522.1 NAD(P)-dependent oxidoreductase [Moorena sp. SIO2B7]EGJ32607.1 hydroxyacid dehydrogenase/reductase family protein [Moorena producens 3L]NEP66398.1 NAD(P)-dependent oxidoreductase [Moorena sp. SIO3A5]NEQ08046.1 NAD(P)-dependent oxidoreductase [Moorena sp. SIO4E2]
MQIGFIGLGNMGSGMVANLLKKGFEVAVYDIQPEKAEALIAAGASWRNSIPEVASDADVIMTSLPGPKQLESVMLGDAGVIAHARPGTIWLDTGTNSIEIMNKISTLASEQTIDSIAAPVSGGAPAAQKGTMSMYVGGNEATFDKIKGILEAIGSQIYYVGPLSHAILSKLLINYLCFINTKALGEVLSLGQEAGIDPKQLTNMIQAGSGSSWVAEKLLPSILEGNPGPAFTLNLAHKDACLVNELNQSFKTSLEFSERLCEVLQQACTTYGGDKSFTRMMDL